MAPPADPFEHLARAEAVYLGPFGYAAASTPELEAYRAAIPIAAEHSETLARLLRVATPSGRFYAALLSAHLGPEAGRRAWESLVSCEDVVSVAPGGCTMQRAPLGHFARSFLTAGDPFSSLPPTPSGPTPSGPTSSGGPAPLPSPSTGVPRRAPTPSVLGRGFTWSRQHPGTLAAIFWLVAGSLYLRWLLGR